jgi:hypothetical protein
MTRRARLAPFLLCLPACYTPHAPVAHDDGHSDESSTSSDESSTSASATSVGSTDASETDVSTGPSETSPPTDSSDSSTTDVPAESSTGAFPYCGDGHVDAGEECDEGDAIGPDSHCLEGCILNVCGDAQLDPGIEACDDGEDANVLEVGACAPDCSRVIEEKIITFGDVLSDGDLGNNPVAFADSTCTAGYKAMFAYPNVREATTVGLAFVGSTDWVVQPYTAYVRESDGALIWITDDVPLLGVRGGAQVPLDAAILDPSCGQFCVAFREITGLDTDWTSAASDTCSLWTSASAANSATTGNPYTQSQFLDNGQSYPCDDLNGVSQMYCVEQ